MRMCTDVHGCTRRSRARRCPPLSSSAISQVLRPHARTHAYALCVAAKKNRSALRLFPRDAAVCMYVVACMFAPSSVPWFVAYVPWVVAGESSSAALPNRHACKHVHPWTHTKQERAPCVWERSHAWQIWAMWRGSASRRRVDARPWHEPRSNIQSNIRSNIRSETRP